MQKHKYLIGIDPGRSTGICVYDPKRNGSDRIVFLETKDFWGTIDFLDNIKKILLPDDMFATDADREIDFEVIIEDPQLNSPLFVQKSKGLNAAVLSNMSQKIGRNKEQAFLLMEYMTRKKIQFRQRKPMNRKHGGGKWDQKTFVFYTGYNQPTNEHARDAVKLVWGL